MDARKSAIFAICYVKPILQTIIHLEVVYVTLENSAFCFFLYLTGIYFRGELKHVGDISEQKIKCWPIRTPEIGGISLNAIHSFRDSVLVCKMHNCYCTICKNFERFHSLQSKRFKRLQLLMKTNHFKMLNVFSTTYTYSNCIVYRLFYCWKIA